MPYNVLAVFDELVVLLTSVANMQKVYEGVPEAFGPSITAYIALTGQDIRDRNNGILELHSSFFIGLGYKVAGAEKDAERKLGAGLVDFIEKFYILRRAKCNGKAKDIALNMNAANTPEYQIVAATEYRVYPILITATLQENTP